MDADDRQREWGSDEVIICLCACREEKEEIVL